MTHYITRRNNMFNQMIDEFFSNASVTRKVTIDTEVLADKANYAIYELPNGSYEIRVSYSDDTSAYYRASTKNSLEEAKEYVNDQIKYHGRQLEGPKKVWDGASSADSA